MVKKHICVICGHEYTRPKTSLAITCSQVCRDELIRRKRAKQDMSTHRKEWILQCVICGEEFRQGGSEHNRSQRVTCSAECSHKLRSQRSRENTPLQRPEVIQYRTIRHHIMPRSGPHATNALAKEWRLRSPEGDEYVFRNLALFLRNHAELFTPGELAGKPPRAQCGLKRLRPEAKEPRRVWHGWTWKHEDEE